MLTDLSLENELSPLLLPGEKLLWAGKPKTGLRLQAGDIFMIPFSLLWGGFALFWESSVILKDAPLLFKIWGIPFVVIGLHMIFGRFLVDSKKRSNTFYGITNDRILIWSGIFRKDLKSVSVKNLPQITLTRVKNGYGTIVLGHNDFRNVMTSVNIFPSGQAVPSLELIPDVNEVYKLLMDLQRKG